MTERYAVIGNPVAHSRSPWIHAEFARATGEDISYERILAPLDGFEGALAAFRAQGGKGLNVTLPFKQAAYNCSTERTGRAAAAQAVNTLTLGEVIRGDNTDGVGLVRDIVGNLGVPLSGRKVLLMGAGGAAQGVADALVGAGVGALVIANRTLTKAQALAARFPGVRALAYDTLQGSFDVLVNATSAGLAGDAISLPDRTMEGALLAYEMVYGRDTPFLAQARAAGVRACDGLGMLVEQAAESFFVWRGVRPPTAPVLAKLRGA